jgi:outer membrane lipoprotein-sorting protein
MFSRIHGAGVHRTTTIFAAALLVASISACSPASAREHEPSASSSTADEIIAQYYRAIGGHDRLEQVVTRHMWGTYSEGTLNAKTDIVWKRPSLRRVNVHAPGFDYSEGSDGKTSIRTNVILGPDELGRPAH